MSDPREKTAANSTFRRDSTHRPAASAGTLLVDRYELIAPLRSSPWSDNWAAYDHQQSTAVIARIVSGSLLWSPTDRRVVRECIEAFAYAGQPGTHLAILEWGRSRCEQTDENVHFVIGEPTGACALDTRIDSGFRLTGEPLRNRLREIAAASIACFDGDDWIAPVASAVMLTATSTVRIDHSTFALQLGAVETGRFPDLDGAEGLGLLGAELVLGSFVTEFTALGASTKELLLELAQSRVRISPDVAAHDEALVSRLLAGDLDVLRQQSPDDTFAPAD